MLIDGLALAGYRSFGKSVQRIGPFEQINLFAGQNNSGKSNILRFMTYHLALFVKEKDQRKSPAGLLSNIDRHIGTKHVRFVFGFGRRANDARYQTLRKKLPGTVKDLFDRVLTSRVLAKDTDCVWGDRISSRWETVLESTPDIVEVLMRESQLREPEWSQLFRDLCPTERGGRVDAWVREILKVLDPFPDEAPRVELIPSVRRIGEKGTAPDDFSGIGIIDRLAQLQNPSHTDQEKKRHFQEINEFLREVLGDPEAELEIPYSRETIHVHKDGRTLPLSSLGTGIHEVIILAAAATVLRDQVICMEEPELHLHPVLQRKLIRYLQEKTTNQYFISTHSSHFLDSPGVAVFHVQLHKGETFVTSAPDAMTKSSICVDLGCRASDLMQSNCVIWVEGPSDRIYLKHWIESVASDLIEGIHYSIMFYGGRLLSHLTADDPDVDEFISLRRLNRNLVIMMDSDRSSAGEEINATKTRIRKEFDQAPGHAWVTTGREIENYVAPEVLRVAVDAVKAGFGAQVRAEQYERVLPLVDPNDESPVRVDKIKVAHEVAKRPADLSVLDLKQQVERLVAFIHTAND